MLNMKRDPSRKVISIIGTTGVGKSQLSIELAKAFNGEIINADSMQMYVELDNITNKHPIEEREGIVHHVMNHIPWREQYYIHRFKKECEEAMNNCWKRGKIPILVGGTHYYLQSVLFDNKTIGSNEEACMNAQQDKEAKDIVTTGLTGEQKAILNSDDSALIFKTLKEVDPVIASKFHPNDIRRVKRALEVYYVSGEKASTVYRKQRETMAEKGTSLKYDTLFLWIYSKIPELDVRLDQRVDKMMQNGGLAELADLYDFYEQELERGNEEVVKMDKGVWQVIGFKEFLPVLAGNGAARLKQIDTGSDTDRRMAEIDKLIHEDVEFAKCCDEMKMKTRRYARKQVKWIKNLLAPELFEEEQLGFVKYGKIFVLDATDLSVWRETVGSRAKLITEEFLDKGYVDEESGSGEKRQIPDTLQGEKLIDEQNGASSGKMQNWVHHECEICTDRETGKPLVYVGEQWAIHLKSKKHKFNLNRGKRKKEYEEWLKKNPGGRVTK
ncbi:hypothetical protein PMKS-002041 [Pichia membranifaciens]|uniref:tRNA dimethylallyltransferase n=1 Tax=Pichia membranifaciens TaxID=4926 RepID=A0A1Q2YG77_9ASCO|nr:hypothetical protein PMKS-002041 [Pichia membranifaciens]